MSTPGKGVVLASGKRGVRKSGKSAVFNGNGACSSCCDVVAEPCEYCKDGTTPRTLAVTFADLIPRVACYGGCYLSDYYDWTPQGWPATEIIVKWVEPPAGFDEFTLNQRDDFPCEYDGLALPTAGKMACYAWMDDCEGDVNRLATLDVAYFYAHAQYFDSGNVILRMVAFFLAPDGTERTIIGGSYQWILYSFYSVTPLPQDEVTSFNTECLSAWDDDNDFMVENIDSLMYGGTVNVVPHK